RRRVPFGANSILLGASVASLVAMGCSEGGRGDAESVLEPPEQTDFNLRAGVRDPGPRTGAAAAGSAFPGLTAEELETFADGQEDFEEVDSVSGTIDGEDG